MATDNPIITTTSMKQLYRYRFGKYLLSDDVDAIYELWKINCHLMPIKEINTLKPDLGTNYPNIIRLHDQYTPLYEYCKQIRQILIDAKEEKTKEYYKAELMRQCSRLPQVNKSIIYVFMSLTLNTDLQKIPIQSPTIQDKHDNRKDLMFTEEQY